MSNIRLSEDMIGKKVRCIYKDGCYHPEVGTIGTIVRYDSYDVNSNYKVQWPKGSTIGDDKWWAFNDCIELVENGKTRNQEIPDMTNEEIWGMLKPKMGKNGLEEYNDYQIYLISQFIKNPRFYYEEEVHNAIALAYKVGYLRSQKGRPFKIGEKKGVTE